MLTDQSCLIVEDALCVSCSVHTLRVHHREFPEIRAECGSVTEGVTHLIGQLTCARENIESQWHRELIDRAIAEVTDCLDALAKAGEDNEALCRCAPHVPDQIEPTLPERSTSL